MDSPDVQVKQQLLHWYRPSEALEDCEPICGACSAALTWFWELDGQYLCENCVESHLPHIIEECQQYAHNECEITADFPPYDAALEYRPTRREYAEGCRDAYSPRAWLSRVRHECTNYDDLISHRDSFDLRDRVKYVYVRHRIHALIAEIIGHNNEPDP
jgi:hypothetical protein